MMANSRDCWALNLTSLQALLEEKVLRIDFIFMRDLADPSGPRAGYAPDGSAHTCRSKKRLARF